MQNIFKILLRYGNFLVFICLEVAAFLLFALNNAYPRSSILSSANQVIAWQNSQITEIKNYFFLKEHNEQLALENTALRNRIRQIEETIEDSTLLLSSNVDSTTTFFLPAKVVHLTTRDKNNFMTINRGQKDNLHRGQGVINSDGVVGVVQTVGKQYSVVLPIINTHTRVSCRFTKNDYIGTLQWDGKDDRFATLTDVASHLVVNQGDTIVTSGLSPVFPEGIPVGTIEECILQEGDAYHTISVRLFTNFKRIKYVNVVCNTHQQEIEELTHELE